MLHMFGSRCSHKKQSCSHAGPINPTPTHALRSGSAASFAPSQRVANNTGCLVRLICSNTCQCGNSCCQSPSWLQAKAVHQLHSTGRRHGHAMGAMEHPSHLIKHWQRPLAVVAAESAVDHVHLGPCTAEGTDGSNFDGAQLCGIHAHMRTCQEYLAAAVCPANQINTQKLSAHANSTQYTTSWYLACKVMGQCGAPSALFKAALRQAVPEQQHSRSPQQRRLVVGRRRHGVRSRGAVAQHGRGKRSAAHIRRDAHVRAGWRRALACPQLAGPSPARL